MWRYASRSRLLCQRVPVHAATTATPPRPRERLQPLVGARLLRAGCVARSLLLLAHQQVPTEHLTRKCTRKSCSPFLRHTSLITAEHIGTMLSGCVSRFIPTCVDVACVHRPCNSSVLSGVVRKTSEAIGWLRQRGQAATASRGHNLQTTEMTQLA